MEQGQTSTPISTGRAANDAPGFVARMSIWLVDRFMGGGDKKAREMERFLKFLVVGTFGFVVDAGTGAILLTLLKPESGSVLIGTISMIAFAAAIIHNFIWNRYWTYPDSRSKPLSSQLVQFAVVNVIGGGIRFVIFRVLEPPFGDVAGRVFTRAGHDAVVAMGYYGALAVAVIVVLFWNFFINRYWTYSDVK